MKKIPLFTTIISVVVVLVLSAFVVIVPHNANHYPLVTELYDGSANIVSAIYLDFRLYDTLFEVLIFSIAIVGVSMYASRVKESGKILADNSSLINFDLLFLSVVIILFGLYTVLTGHLQPGGAFSGGAITASGIVVLTMALGSEKIHKVVERSKLEWFENGVIMIILSYVMFADIPGGFFSPGFSIGNVGDFLSGRGALLLNGTIGFKVFVGGWLIFYEFSKRKESL